MMLRYHHALKGFALAFLLGPCCFAFPVAGAGSGVINPGTFAAADLVCVGEFSAPVSVGRQAAEVPGSTPVDVIHQIASFSSSRCFKGHAPVGLTVAYDTHEPSRGWPNLGIPVGSETLVFLSRGSNGSYVFASREFAMWHVATGASAGSDDGGIEELERDLSSGLTISRSNEDRLADLVALVAFDHADPETLRVVRTFEGSARPREAIAALLICIKSGDPGGVDALSSYLIRRAAEINVYILQEFSFYPLELVSDPLARAALETLGHSQFIWVSMPALEGVRHLRDPKSIPDLIKHLDDADPTLRYIAVITLAEITGKFGEFAPSMRVYDENRARVVKLWKTWWEDAGQKQPS